MATGSWRFRIRNPSGVSKVVETSIGLGPDSTVKHLKAAVATLFSTPEAQFVLKFGLPPKPVPDNDDLLTLKDVGLSDQESLSMVTHVGATSPANPVSQKSKPTAKKKKAARGSEESDSDDSSMGSLPSTDDDAEEGGGRNHVRPPKPKTHPRTRKPAQGIRLPKRPKQTIRNEQELGEKLASAAANETRDSVTKFFRRLTKDEVNGQYEVAAAQAKYEAALKNDFEITPSSAGSSFRLADGAVMETKLTIKYRRHPRSYDTEEVQGLGEDLLKAAIESVLDAPDSTDPDDALNHPREGLRPIMLPRVSPRVFWSLIYLKGGGPDCISKGLRTLLPDRDWSFLDARPRRRTAKAKEWEKTETKLEALDQGLPLSSDEEDVENDERSVDELATIVPTAQNRKHLKRLKITTLVELADADVTQLEDVDEQWINDARAVLLDRFVNDIVDSDSEIKGKLATLDVRTPSDIARLRIPGRTEMVQQELTVERETVEKWKSKADFLVRRHPWLDALRTRG